MAMNLVEQQKVLRDLTDDMLQQAMQGGMAPPYMVLAEINRRKDARERYTAQKAKYDANQATVAQDIMQQMAKATQAAQAPAPTMGGLDSAMGAPMAMEPPVSGGLDAAAPAFADGGMVQKFQSGGMSLGNPSIIQSLMGGAPAPAAAPATGGMSVGNPAMMSSLFSSIKNDVKPFQFKYPTYQNPYSSLIDLYTSQIEGLDKERENARAMALIAAGTGMMQGGQNTLKNIGAAFGPALSGYQEQINNLSQTERDLMAGRVNAEVMGKQAEKDAKASYEDSPEGRAELAKQMGFEPGSDEYNSYVYLKTNPVLKPKYRGGFVNGTDPATGNPTSAIFDENKGWVTAAGIPIPDFQPYGEGEKAQQRLAPKEFTTFKDVTTSVSDTLSYFPDKVSAVDEALKVLENPDTARQVTGLSSLFNFVPGGQSGDFGSLIANIASNQAFDTIQALKAAGGGSTGLGATTEIEFKALQSAVSALNQANSPDAIKKALENIRYHYRKMRTNLINNYNFKYGATIDSLDPNDPKNADMLDFIRLRNLRQEFSDPEGGGAGGATYDDPLA